MAYQVNVSGPAPSATGKTTQRVVRVIDAVIAAALAKLGKGAQ